MARKADEQRAHEDVLLLRDAADALDRWGYAPWGEYVRRTADNIDAFTGGAREQADQKGKG